ncbi:hypothetical protein AB0H51_10930 [Streptomyces griseoluteus]|uniref:hypothetical protein n=1 Tax=Streptomyces griseoluteus TaxID=29306 RepID=UPI0033D21E58
MISHRLLRGGLLSTTVAGSLFLGATACGGDGDKNGLPKDYKVVAGTQLCGGNAISADASKSLKVITGSSRFEASSKESTVVEAAANLALATPALTSGSEDICRVFTPIGSTPHFNLRVTWSLAEGAPKGTPSPKFTVLKMGEETLAGTEKAYVFFACQSDKLVGSLGEAHIVIGVERGGMPRDPQDNVKALKNAYATVAHSFSLAMAKELRCDKNGGLPPKPVLVPA